VPAQPDIARRLPETLARSHGASCCSVPVWGRPCFRRHVLADDERNVGILSAIGRRDALVNASAAMATTGVWPVHLNYTTHYTVHVRGDEPVAIRRRDSPCSPAADGTFHLRSIASWSSWKPAAQGHARDKARCARFARVAMPKRTARAHSRAAQSTALRPLTIIFRHAQRASRRGSDAVAGERRLDIAANRALGTRLYRRPAGVLPSFTRLVTHHNVDALRSSPRACITPTRFESRQGGEMCASIDDDLTSTPTICALRISPLPPRGLVPAGKSSGRGRKLPSTSRCVRAEVWPWRPSSWRGWR